MYLLSKKKNLTIYEYRRIINSVLLLAFIVFFFGIYQFISFNFYQLPFDQIKYNSPGFEGLPVKSYFSGWIRACSIFKEPTHLGFFASHILILMLTSSTIVVSKPVKSLFLLLAIILIFLSYSLAAILALAIISAYFFITNLSFKTIILAFLFLAVILILPSDMRLVKVVKELLSFDLTSFSDGSSVVRVIKIILGLSIFFDNPILGIGGNQIGNYDIISFVDVSSTEYSQDIYFVNFHIIGILAESGIVGLSVWFIILIRSFIYIEKNASSEMRLASKYLILLNVAAIDLPIFSPFRLLPLAVAFLFVKQNRD